MSAKIEKGFVDGFIKKCAEANIDPRELVKLAAPRLPGDIEAVVAYIRQMTNGDPRAGKRMFEQLMKEDPELMRKVMARGARTGSTAVRTTLNNVWAGANEALRTGRRFTPFSTDLVPVGRRATPGTSSAINRHGLTADDLAAMARAEAGVDQSMLPVRSQAAGPLAVRGANGIVSDGTGLPARLSDVEASLEFGPGGQMRYLPDYGTVDTTGLDDTARMARLLGLDPEDVGPGMRRRSYTQQDVPPYMRQGITPEDAEVIDAMGLGAGSRSAGGSAGAAADAADTGAAARAAGSSGDAFNPGTRVPPTDAPEAPGAPGAPRRRTRPWLTAAGGAAAGLGIGAALVNGSNQEGDASGGYGKSQGATGQEVPGDVTTVANGGNPIAEREDEDGIFRKQPAATDATVAGTATPTEGQPGNLGQTGQPGWQPSTSTPLTPLPDRRMAGGAGMGYLSDIGITPDQVEAMSRYYNQNRNGKFRAIYPTFGDFYNKANSLPAAQRNEGFRRMGINTGVYVDGPDGKPMAWQSGTPTNLYSKAAEAGYKAGFMAKMAQYNMRGLEPFNPWSWKNPANYPNWNSQFHRQTPGWSRAQDFIIPEMGSEYIGRYALDTATSAMQNPRARTKSQANAREGYRQAINHNLGIDMAQDKIVHNNIMAQHAQEQQRTAGRQMAYQANLAQQRQHDQEFAAKQQQWDAQRAAHQQRIAAIRSRMNPKTQATLAGIDQRVKNTVAKSAVTPQVNPAVTTGAATQVGQVKPVQPIKPLAQPKV